MNKMDKKLYELLENSENIVFFGGAGVSTASGIPDFRSENGLYSTKFGSFSPETMLSKTFFNEHPVEFYEFYKSKMIFEHAKPNNAHKTLAKLERQGKLKAVITQNIDNLHQSAGSRNVLELHGSVYRNYCVKCGKSYDLNYIVHSNGVPKCLDKNCNGIIRPDVVLYEEQLDNKIVEKAINYIKNADILLIGGTSLIVYPAAGFIDYYRGNKLVFINKTQTQRDDMADYLFYGDISQILNIED